MTHGSREVQRFGRDAPLPPSAIPWSRTIAHVIMSPGDAVEADDQDPLGSAGHSCLKYRATGQRS